MRVVLAKGALRSGIGSARTLGARKLGDIRRRSRRPNVGGRAGKTDREEISTGPTQYAGTDGKSAASGSLSKVLRLEDLCFADADALNVFEVMRRSRALHGRHASSPARCGICVTLIRGVIATGSMWVRCRSRAGATVLLRARDSHLHAGRREIVIARKRRSEQAAAETRSGIAGTPSLRSETPPGSVLRRQAWSRAEFCQYIRGMTLEDVLYALPRA